jgi:hypothetical protein
MPLPSLIPPFAPKNPDGSYQYNCTFKVKNNVSTGATNALGNPVIDFDETEVSGWAVREMDTKLLQTIGASVEEVPIKVWIQNPKCLPANFAAFNNVKCELTLSGILQRGIFRPVPMGHPFIPADFQFVIGAFKGQLA